MTLSPLAITFTRIGSLEFLGFLHEFKGPSMMKNNEAPFSRENLVLANDSNYPRIRVICLPWQNSGSNHCSSQSSCQKILC